MFGFSKKKSEVEKLIDLVGFDHATAHISQLISEMLTAEEIAHQFVLEEIEAASQGDEAAKEFARTSGIEPWEYEGAMQNSHPAIDGDGGPQQTLVALCLQLHSNPDLMLKFRTMIVDKIMKKFELGKYGESEVCQDDLIQDEIRLVNIVDKNEDSEYGAFVNINNDLADFIESNENCNGLHKMAYGYARRCAAAGMYAQAIIDRETYDYVSQTFKELQQLIAHTVVGGHTVEFQEDAGDQALELIETYTDLFDRESIKFMTAMVEGGLDNAFLGGEPQSLIKTSIIINALKEKHFTKQ